MDFKEEFIGVIDLGTTSVRFILFNLNSEICYLQSKQIKQFYPETGWVNEDPKEIWEATQEVIGLCVEKINIMHLLGIAICNQRESTMVWDKATGEALSDLIVWQDRRTADRCRILSKEIDLNILRIKTGLILDPYFSATKLEWLLLNNPSFKENENLAFGTLDSWIIFKLTGEHLTDASNASRTLLFNINDLKWDDELLNYFNIPKKILPRVLNNFGKGIFGYTTAQSVFNQKIPICSVFGDQQSALFGQKCFNEGDSKSTFGTGSFLMMNTGEKKIESKNNLLTTIFYQDSSSKVFYALEGSTYNAGSIYQWLKEELGLIKDYSEIAELAIKAEYQKNLFLVPAFTGLGSPFWDPYARGLLIGIERSTGRKEIVRASLEAAAYRTVDVMNAMRLDSCLNLNFLKIDGGVSKDKAFPQILADLTGVKIIKFDMKELTALGAFFGASLGLGIWRSPKDLKDDRKTEIFLPILKDETRKDLYNNWLKAVERCRNWSTD